MLYSMNLYAILTLLTESTGVYYCVAHVRYELGSKRSIGKVKIATTQRFSTSKQSQRHEKAKVGTIMLYAKVRCHLSKQIDPVAWVG